MLMGQQGQSRTPGQGQDTGRYPLDTKSLLSSKSSARMLMGQRGQARTPGQGQDTLSIRQRHHPTTEDDALAAITILSTSD